MVDMGAKKRQGIKKPRGMRKKQKFRPNGEVKG